MKTLKPETSTKSRKSAIPSTPLDDGPTLADHLASAGTRTDLMLDREERRSAVLCAVPVLGDTDLDGFIGHLFSDDTLVDAYLQVVASRWGERQAELALNRSIQSLRCAREGQSLLAHERPVAALAAFLMEAGTYLHRLELSRGKCAEAHPKPATLIRLRNDALFWAMKWLRRQSPEIAALLGAVLGADSADEQAVNEDQVRRVRAAVRNTAFA